MRTFATAFLWCFASCAADHHSGIGSTALPAVGIVPAGGADDRAAATADLRFPPTEFRARRSRVYEAIGSDIAILYGADSGENYRRPRQYNNFYYLTGEERTGAALVLDGRTRQATLFLPNMRGDRAAQAEQERLGIERVQDLATFADTLRAAAAGRSRIFLPLYPGEGNAQARDSFWPPHSRPKFPGDRRPSRPQDFRAGVLEITGAMDVMDLERVIDPLRRVKSAAEIQVMREAGRIGAEAIADAVRATRPGSLERELEGVCELAFLRNGAHASAWTTIVATGPNITNFHYFENSRRIADGDMVLVDAGPDYNYYCSDITRVWPASGPYPPRYRELYDKLLEVHKTTIAAIKPGITIREVGRVMRDAAKAQGIERYVLPGPGHYTGMAPHDVGDYNAPFEPGVVFNVEPLLVVAAEGLHIRLEDTVLCTQDGFEVLTDLGVLPWEADSLLKMRGAARD